MFKTTRDAANREAVRAVARADLNLVGPVMVRWRRARPGRGMTKINAHFLGTEITPM